MIRGILFDAGDTLVRPLEGEWFPGASIRQALKEIEFDDKDGSRLLAAHQEGVRYLNIHHHMDSEEEEMRQMLGYCGAVFTHLGVPMPNAERLHAMAASRVTVMDMAPYEDTLEGVRRFRELGYKVGIVSNAWPSLDRKFRELGLRDEFDFFVVSALVGCFKPGARIFEHAIAESGLPPEDLVFLDDIPRYVNGAANLGIHGVVISRSGVAPDTTYPWVKDLAEFEQYLLRINA